MLEDFWNILLIVLKYCILSILYFLMEHILNTQKKLLFASELVVSDGDDGNGHWLVF